MNYTALFFVVLFGVFAVCLSHSINRDSYNGNGKLDKYDFEREDDEKRTS